MKQVKCVKELTELVHQKKSVCYGLNLTRVPAAVFVNFTFSVVYNLLQQGRVFIYEPKNKRAK